MDSDWVTQFGESLVLEVNKATLAQVGRKPTTPIINLELIDEEALVKYIRSKHSQEFAKFYVHNDESFRSAARWFLKELRGLYAFLYDD